MSYYFNGLVRVSPLSPSAELALQNLSTARASSTPTRPRVGTHLSLELDR